jgi:hypothetical protein
VDPDPAFKMNAECQNKKGAEKNWRGRENLGAKNRKGTELFWFLVFNKIS